MAADLEGRPITDEKWRRRGCDWLPFSENRAFVASLVQRVTEQGQVGGMDRVPRCLSGSPGDAETAEGGRAQDRDPVERLARHARRGGEQGGDRRVPRRCPVGGSGGRLQA